MQETYNIGDLIIGELVTISSMGGFYGTMEMTEGPFIFNKKGEKYSEIFTEEEYGLGPKPSSATGGRNYKVSNNIESNTFGKTYIKQTDDIKNYLTKEELSNYNKILKEMINDGMETEEVSVNFDLTKKRLLEIYNQIKEKQIIEKIQRENEEQELEKKYIKK